MIDFTFIALSYTLGPVVSIPYALQFLNLSSLDIFLYLSFLYILALPLIFQAFEFVGHRKLYRNSMIQKICKVCNVTAENEAKKVRKTGDDLIENFENRMGHLGFYIAIAVFTFLFGVFLAAFFAYLLKVKRKRALWSISLGILFGNLFWVIVISYSLPRPHFEFLLLLIVILSLIYGRKREFEILKKISVKLNLKPAK